MSDANEGGASTGGLLMPPLPPAFERRGKPVAADSTETVELPRIKERDEERNREVPSGILRPISMIGFILSIILPPLGVLVGVIMLNLTHHREDAGREFASAGVMIGVTLTIVVGLLTFLALLAVDGLDVLLHAVLSE